MVSNFIISNTLHWTRTVDYIYKYTITPKVSSHSYNSGKIAFIEDI